MKVLIVDENQPFWEFLKNSLADLGYSAENVNSLKEACRLLPNLQPEVLVCGHTPPNLDALSLSKEARKLCPRCSVIIHTPTPTLEIALAAVREHVEALLPKKAELPDLVAIFDEIEKKSARINEREEQHSRLVMEYARLKRSYDEMRGQI